MQKLPMSLEEKKLVGLKVKTNNKNELVEGVAGKIALCVQQYFQQQIPEKIIDRKNSGITFCAYTEYESDYAGDYTFFIGEEVTTHENVIKGLEVLTIPKQKYIKFTTPSGTMPNVVTKAWQKIWNMSANELGGMRQYHTDFEAYDERARDPQNTVLDIYIGVKE